jgi:hypothetical protein
VRNEGRLILLIGSVAAVNGGGCRQAMT